MMRRAILIAVVALVGCSDDVSDVDKNTRTMERAAASLKFTLPENRAHMLEKHWSRRECPGGSCFVPLLPRGADRVDLATSPPASFS